MKYLYALFLLLVFLVIQPQSVIAQETCPEDNICITSEGRACNSQGGTVTSCTASTGQTGNCCLPLPEPSGQPIPEGPFPNEYIPCGGVGGPYIAEPAPEFHSLRPYQASPCLRELDELDLYCGNDLITVKTYDVSASDAEYCEVEGGITTCYFEFDEVARVGIGLDDAELPIMGNTQLVSNKINGGVPQPERFEWPRLVNEYFTWWLNGTSYMAEDYLHFHPGVREDEGALVDFGGPLKKLLPRGGGEGVNSPPYGMWRWRDIQRSAVLSPNPEDQMHNHIFMCNLGTQQVPCWYDFVNGRYEDVNGVELNTRRLRSLGSVESPWMAFTNTTDRLGVVFIDMDTLQGFPAQPTGDEGQGATITDLSFTPEVRGDLLYFPHMQEGNDLADALQSTYVPRGLSRTQFSEWGEEMDTYNTYRCNLEDVRWNTGDDLFGELGGDHLPEPVTLETGEEITGESISALVSYTSNFQCEWSGEGEPGFCPSGFCIPGCVDACQSGAGNCTPPPPPWDDPPDVYGCCLNACDVSLTCTVDALTASSVYTRTPHSEELWDRTVNGATSMMKRILPKIGSSGMFSEWKDWPAVTTASYQVEQVEGGPGTYSTLAGDPNSRRDGSRAEIYIPHLGGIKVFAMDILQDTLRPREMGSNYTGVNNGGLPPGSGDIGGQCSTGTGFCAPEDLSPPWSDADAITASKICQRESGGSPTALNDDCLRCSDGIDNDGDNIIDLDDPDCDGATADYSVGLFQINLHPLATFTPRCPGAFEMNYAANNTGDNPLRWCRVIDQAALDQCVAFYSDPSNNIDAAFDLFSGNNSFCGNWSTAGPDVCGLCPS